MKIVIAILSANNIIAERNTEAQLNTFAKGIFEKQRNNEYRVYFYRAIKENETPGIYKKDANAPIYDVLTDTGDDIYATYEKTADAYNMILSDWDFDIMIRCNISCYLNIGLLDVVLREDYDENLIVANSINTIITFGKFTNNLYPRGDFYIIRKDLMARALKNSDRVYGKRAVYLDHIDDVLFGVNLIDALGDDYYENLKTCLYEYIPYEIPDKLNLLSLNWRLKTIPKGVRYSGYNWEDEETRRDDVEKFYNLHEHIKKIEYSDDIELSQLLYDDSQAKPVIFAYAKSIGLDKAKEALRKKSGK